MSDLTAKFTTLENQLSSEHTDVMSAIADLQTAIDLINTQLDTQTINNAANTKAILGALGQSGACFPCPTPSIVVPATPTTSVTINTALCQRAQGLIQTIRDILAGMDTLQSYNVVGSFNVLNDAISEVIGSVAAGDTVPLPSFPETVNIVGDYISYAGERLFSGVGLVEQFDPIKTDLINGVYNAGSAEAAQSSYASIIDGSSVSNGAKLLFKAVAYNALWGYYFDPDSTPDVSGYDGGACTYAGGCLTLDAPLTVQTGVTRYMLEWAGPIAGTGDYGSGGITADHNVFTFQNIDGWTMDPSVNVSIYFDTGGGFDTASPGFPYTFHDTVRTFVICRDADVHFTAELCPPGA